MIAVRTRAVIYSLISPWCLHTLKPSPRQPSPGRLCFLHLTAAASAKVLRGALVQPAAPPLLISPCVVPDAIHHGGSSSKMGAIEQLYLEAFISD